MKVQQWLWLVECWSLGRDENPSGQSGRSRWMDVVGNSELYYSYDGNNLWAKDLISIITSQRLVSWIPLLSLPSLAGLSPNLVWRIYLSSQRPETIRQSWCWPSATPRLLWKTGKGILFLQSTHFGFHFEIRFRPTLDLISALLHLSDREQPFLGLTVSIWMIHSNSGVINQPTPRHTLEFQIPSFLIRITSQLDWVPFVNYWLC